jgi:hypothetical protein
MSASTFRVAHPISGTRPAEESDTTPVRVFVPRFPSLTTTVPKELVHRASVSEVMLTDWARVDDEHYTLAAQWPRGHSFFTNVDGCHDPLIAAETIRQAGIGVDWTPATLELQVTCSEVKLRGKNLLGFRISVEIRRDGQVAATGGGSLTCITPRVYQRLRAGRLRENGMPQVIQLTAPEAPQVVGRISPTDVVLSPIGQPNRWQLRVDTRHPVLFDHMVDHVPGMVLMEAARQAATATLGRASLPLDVISEFTRYVELDAPCVVEAQRLPASGHKESVLVTAYQNDALVFRCTVSLPSVTG